MKRILILTIALLALALSACGNPVEQLQEAASEQIAETIVEQVTGAEDIEFDAENGSVSFSVDNGEGGQVDVSVDENSDIEAITGMGFNIAVPDGLVNGTLQRIDNNGEEMMVNATFETEGMTTEELYQAMHESLTAEGFTYFDPTNSGRTEPDSENIQMIVAYQHPDGYQFTIMGDATGVLFGLVRLEDGAMAADTAVAQPNPTTLDGSMALDKSSYQVGEPIEVTLVINSPLPDNAWVGIVPSNTPHGLETDGDAADVTYDYVVNAVDGVVTVYPPYAGAYDVRLYSSDSSGVELASESITVTE